MSEIIEVTYDEAWMDMEKAHVQELWSFPLPLLQQRLLELNKRANRTLFGRFESDVVPKIKAELNLHEVDLNMELTGGDGIALTIHAKHGNFYNSRDVGNSYRPISDATFCLRGSLIAEYNKNLTERRAYNPFGNDDSDDAVREHNYLLGYVYDVKLGNFADYDLLDGFTIHGGKDIFDKFLKSMRDSGILGYLWTEMTEAFHNNGPLCQIAFSKQGPIYRVISRPKDTNADGLTDIGIDIMGITNAGWYENSIDRDQFGSIIQQVIITLDHNKPTHPGGRTPNNISTLFPTFKTPCYWASSRCWTSGSVWPWDLDRMVEVANQVTTLKHFESPPGSDSANGFFMFPTDQPGQTLRLPTATDRMDGQNDTPGSFTTTEGYQSKWGQDSGASHTAILNSWTTYWVVNSGNRNWTYLRQLQGEILRTEHNSRPRFVSHFSQHYGQFQLDLSHRKGDPDNGSSTNYGQRRFWSEDWFGVDIKCTFDRNRIVISYSEVYDPRKPKTDIGDSWSYFAGSPVKKEKHYYECHTSGQPGIDLTINVDQWNDNNFYEQRLLANSDCDRVQNFMRSRLDQVDKFLLPVGMFKHQIYTNAKFGNGHVSETAVLVKIDGLLLKGYQPPIPS